MLCLNHSARLSVNWRCQKHQPAYGWIFMKYTGIWISPKVSKGDRHIFFGDQTAKQNVCAFFCDKHLSRLLSQVESPSHSSDLKIADCAHLTNILLMPEAPSTRTASGLLCTPWKNTSTSKLLSPRLLQNWAIVTSRVAPPTTLKGVIHSAPADRETVGRNSVSEYRVCGCSWEALIMKVLSRSTSQRQSRASVRQESGA